MKNNPKNCRKYLQIIFLKRLVTKIKNSYNSIKTNNPPSKWAKELNRHFFQENIQMVKMHTKKMLMIMSLGKCKSKPQ